MNQYIRVIEVQATKRQATCYQLIHLDGSEELVNTDEFESTSQIKSDLEIMTFDPDLEYTNSQFRVINKFKKLTNKCLLLSMNVDEFGDSENAEYKIIRKELMIMMLLRENLFEQIELFADEIKNK
jgi:hypothetical protein